MSKPDPPTSKASTFLPSDSFAIERIFPIRNLVDPRHNEAEGTAVPEVEKVDTKRNDTASKLEISPVDTSTEYEQPPWPPVPPDHLIRRMPSTPRLGPIGKNNEDAEIKRNISARSQMVPEKHGGVPGVVPGAVASSYAKPTFHNCEDEPIHIPGAIQSYGALVVLKYDENDNLLVRIASENSQHILSYSPNSLFLLPSFLDVIEESEKEGFQTRVDHFLEVGHDTSGNTDLDVFTLKLRSPDDKELRFWCAMHLTAKTSDLVICEFEVQDENFFPGAPGLQTLPKRPTSTLDNDFVPGERLKSITSMSKPLRVLQIAHKQHHRIGFMEMFNAMSQVQQQLGATQSLQNVLDVVVGLVREMTHFDRVMVYRFDQQNNGCVEAELVDPRASDDLFRGLHFPASDIPAQARELYKINKIRLLFDLDAETARLVCRDDTDFLRPLDLTHSYLRAMSPIHLKYLGNMGVRSSMSISLVIKNELWGLVACHSYGEHGIRVPLPIRELCRNIGECASINIERLLMARRLKDRRPLEYAPPEQNPSEFIAASSADLLRIFDAEFGLLSIQDEARAIGRLNPYREALAILAHLQKRKMPNIVASQNLNVDFPDIQYEPGIKTISGVLVIPLSIVSNDFIVFFRRGQLKEVRWAGNPYEKIVRAGTASYLEPRSSFKRWTEKVSGTSKEWTDDQLETASILSLLYGRFIQVWRQKELAVQKSRLTKLLLRNSSHEVRTPLNAIINYLELALENQLDSNTREVLLKAHKASRSLIYVIDDLLNLTKVEAGRIVSPPDTFDLGTTVSEVISTFQKEAARKGIDLTVSSHQGLPETVRGDAARLRQVLSNVTSNAFQNSKDGAIKVDIRMVRVVSSSKSIVSITIQDNGKGMSEQQLDDLFQEFEQILDEDIAITASEIIPMTPGNEIALGLGLAVVARYVRNMAGQIKVRSEPGKGTIFTIELPFEHAASTPAGVSILEVQSTPRSDLTPGSNTDTMPTSSVTDVSSQSIDPPGPPKTYSSSSGLLRKPDGLLHQRLHSIDTAIYEAASAGHDSISGISGGMGNLSMDVQSTYPFPDMSANFSDDESRVSLTVLLAEDNPVNARVLRRRLEKSGHDVQLAVDGQACYDIYSQNSDGIDVILMDLQMPLVDGPTSTQMIRELEDGLGNQGPKKPRVPIFAVSASLTEDQRFDYVEFGFDAWVLKPIDYNRLEFLMQGTYKRQSRSDSVYVPGSFERGGWFER